MKINQSKSSKLNGKPFKFAVILPRFNDHLGQELYQNTKSTLLKNGVQEKNILLTRVPGSLETPYSALHLSQTQDVNAIIALGIVIKGDTSHYDLVCEESYRGLMAVSLGQNIPIIFGILTVNNLKQAIDRISAKKMNKGKEFAESAIEMAQLANN